MPRSRTWLALVAVLVVLAGLATRSSYATGLVGEYGGDVLYAVLIVDLVLLVVPDLARARAGLTALSICFVIETSQLVAVLDPVREYRLAALVLGRGFLWTDLVCYALGVLVALAVDQAAATAP